MWSLWLLRESATCLVFTLRLCTHSESVVNSVTYNVTEHLDEAQTRPSHIKDWKQDVLCHLQLGSKTFDANIHWQKQPLAMKSSAQKPFW